MKINRELWDKFSVVVDLLKKQKLLDSDESKTSIVQDYIGIFTIEHIKKLREQGLYEDTIERLEENVA